MPVFDSVEAAAAALAETIRALQPLSGANTGFNAGFAEVAAEVYRRWAE